MYHLHHHQSNNNFGIIDIVDVTKASSAEVLYEFYKQNN
jgi:phosphoesterase RecJ-like protein